MKEKDEGKEEEDLRSRNMERKLEIMLGMKLKRRKRELKK